MPGTPYWVSPDSRPADPVEPASRPEDWRWSSVTAHRAGADDHVVRVAPGLDRVGDFRTFLGEDFDDALEYAALRKSESVGRPVGSAAWLNDMEARIGRVDSQ